MRKDKTDIPRKSELKQASYAQYMEDMRNKLEVYGIDLFQDYEILEILLYGIYKRNDAHIIAKQLIERFGSLYGVFEADYNELKVFKGLGAASAMLIKLQKVFLRYYENIKKELIGLKVDNKNITHYIKSLFSNLMDENIYMISINRNHDICSVDKLGDGDIGSAVMDMRKFIRIVLDVEAKYLILAHNHPGSITKPSYMDCILTQLIDIVSETMRIQLWDHLIVVDDDLVSIKQYIDRNGIPENDNI